MFHPLHAIVDVDAAARAGRTAHDVGRAYLEGGARFLQIRAKHLPAAPFLALCDALVRLAASFAATVIVNDRVDLAAMSGAAGAHVGQEDLPPGAARWQLGARAIVGLSTHSLEQIDRAISEPITYLAVGPVFGTTTKDTGYEAVGLDLVRAARARVPAPIPIVAIGGITLELAASVLAAGASQVAVIGDLLATGDPRGRVEAYCRALM